ncbi:MAG: hypothetical protein P4L95_12055 [Rouxiella aceris]|uniref:hypothetical protein n=1 Tax=Rouxiella aceris TaxID=2703884 RepID=UPI00283EE779|nr:hypothetical protein [Rouxiella aceris]MDR3432613.1 hypothetical protein [Rouxiella aceris]
MGQTLGMLRHAKKFWQSEHSIEAAFKIHPYQVATGAYWQPNTMTYGDSGEEIAKPSFSGKYLRPSISGYPSAMADNAEE